MQTTSILIRGRQREVWPQRRWPQDDRVRDRRDAAVSQGTPAATRRSLLKEPAGLTP
jgi:hypothetical protein